MLDTQLQQLVTTTAPRTTSLLGIKTGHAGQFLVTAGENIDRLSKGESSFAALCAAGPVKASSGKPTATVSPPAVTGKPTERCT